MSYQNFSALFGFLVWFAATFVVRFWGHLFFSIKNMVFLICFFIVTGIALILLTHWVFNKFKLSKLEIPHAAVLMVVPGMIGDVICLGFYQYVFPKMGTDQIIILAVWILWAYVVVLCFGASMVRGQK